MPEEMLGVQLCFKCTSCKKQNIKVTFNVILQPVLIPPSPQFPTAFLSFPVPERVFPSLIYVTNLNFTYFLQDSDFLALGFEAHTLSDNETLGLLNRKTFQCAGCF